MYSTSPERLQSISDRTSGRQRTFDALKAAWPDGAEFSGTDKSGALTVTISAQGDVAQVDLVADWSKRIDERSLARAINEAIGAASIPLVQQWSDNLDPDAPDGTSCASSRPQMTLDEYRCHVPAPQSLGDLEAQFNRLAAARYEYARLKSQLDQPPAHESFESPRGLFRVTRSRANLLALTYERNALTFIDKASIEREIMSSLVEIRRRDSSAQAELSASFPALAALRERQTEL